MIRNSIAVLLAAAPLSIAAGEGEVDFGRDIRPILSAKCFACHGPDSKDRDADYRLDTKEGAFADLGGYAGIVPGSPGESELIHRITEEDKDELMPPPKHKNPLTAQEIALLKRWIADGASYEAHWAFEKVKRPEPPTVKAETTNAIDHFIAARLEKERLTFSPEAAAETLVRRLHLDLTGLPPTLEEVDAFLAKPGAATYEATIDRLMASPHFAERLALDWLDVARFADTNGYSIDDHRDMWVWRDWVIEAFRSGMPYDRFIHEQLAGDLMESATERQKIATGFLRNSMNTHEGGTIAEEYRVASIADKIDTVATAFMGLTMKCAQCHDHKYDPISMRDYYRFFAIFNTSTEPGTGATNGNTKPLLEVAPILQDADTFRKGLEQRIARLEYLKAHPEDLLGDARVQWERETLAKAGPAAAKAESAAFPLPGNNEASGLSWIWSNKSGAGEFAWFRRTISLAEVPARALLFVSCDNEAEIWLNGKRIGKNPDWRTPTVLDLRPLLVTGENLIAVAGKDWEKGGGKAALLALAAFTDNAGKTRYLSTDASWQAAGKEVATWSTPGQLEGFAPAEIVAAHGAAPWGDVLAKLGGGAAAADALIAALRKPDHERNQAERSLVTAAFAKANSEMGKVIKSIDGEIGVLRKSLKSGKTSAMVMDEGAANRKTPVLERGAYDQHGAIVTAGVPAVFGKLPEGARVDRLALARWLTDPGHPLTARVAVNRYWQMLFGTGLVKTTEDFGSQGEWPSHPELLDWLAAEFVGSGWDVRALLKTMLLSRTYRQSSITGPQLQAGDPYNRLLARAPRYRLPAEAVRDGALAISGQLDLQVGGPSVYPPQPQGLWKEVSHFGYPGFFSAQHYFPDNGQPIFRRSLYKFWKRTSPPPVMTAFDAPNRETCTVRRSLTNTPLQALVLMNAPQFVSASRKLAQRMLQSGDHAAGQIETGFRLATARKPTAPELEIFQSALSRQRAYFAADPERAAGYLRFGPDLSDAAAGVAPVDLAAMTSVASLILNLDETITRE